MITRIMQWRVPEALEAAQQLLVDGNIVAFPTDTVYGVGAVAFNEEAVSKLYRAKERAESKPIPLLIAHPEELSQVAATVPRAAYQLAQAFWPGGLTLVVERGPNIPDAVTAHTPTVAVRCPDHIVPLTLIRAVGSPLATTSANKSGQGSPTTAQEVMGQLSGRLPLIIDDGTCPGGVVSTLVDLTVDPPRILRQGAVSEAALRAVLPGLAGSSPVKGDG